MDEADPVPVTRGKTPSYMTDHRKRLRQRFREGGAAAVPDYELLELVLFRAIPRQDVKPLARELVTTSLSHLDWAAVRETRGLAAGQEPVEVGAGAGRPGDLSRAQGRGHDEAARAAAVTGLLPIMSHAETEYNDVTILK